MVSCLFWEATGGVVAVSSAARTTDLASTRTTGAEAEAAAAGAETSAETTDDASSRSGAITAREEAGPSDPGVVVADGVDRSEVVSETSEIVEAAATQDREALKERADLDRTALKDATRTETVTPATLSVIATVARVNMKKKDTWTERNTTASGLMATNPRGTPIPRRNSPPNKPPKNKSQTFGFATEC